MRKNLQFCRPYRLKIKNQPYRSKFENRPYRLRNDRKCEMYQDLSKRERQIIDIIHRIGEGSVHDVIDQMKDPSGYNSIRVLMTILVKKGQLKHRKEKNKYIYSTVKQKEEVKDTALDHVMKTFFSNDATGIVANLINREKMTKSDLDELSQMIEAAKKESK
jgi:BlaI family penicillinase repressor